MFVEGEKEVNWNRTAKTERKVESLVKQAATKVGWDPDTVWSLVLDNWEGDFPGGYSSYNDKDVHFGFDVEWDGEEVSIYMYSD